MSKSDTESLDLSEAKVIEGEDCSIVIDEDSDDLLKAVRDIMNMSIEDMPSGE